MFQGLMLELYFDTLIPNQLVGTWGARDAQHIVFKLGSHYAYAGNALLDIGICST